MSEVLIVFVLSAASYLLSGISGSSILSDQIEQSVILRVSSGAGYLCPVHLSDMVFVRAYPYMSQYQFSSKFEVGKSEKSFHC